LGNELVLHGGGLDSPLPLSEKAIAEVNDAVDRLIEESMEQGDPETAIAGAKALMEGMQLRGVAVMRLIYKLHSEWEKFGLSESFIDRISVELSLGKKTIRRYLNIYTAVFANEDVPDDLLPTLAEKPVNTLERLVRPVHENKLVVADDWKRIAKAENDSAVRSICQELAGKSPKGRPPVQLHVYQDGKVYIVEGTKKELLMLVKNSPEDLKNPLIAKGYSRFLRGTGAIEI
jgi:hypothetical protein